MPDLPSEQDYKAPEEGLPGKETPQVEGVEIEQLKEKVEQLETQLKKERAPEEREKIVKQEIEKYLTKMQKMPTFAAPKVVRDEAKEIKKFPSTQQVGALVSLVFDKGLHEAISVAKSLNNPAVLDEFHDILVDRYYQILVEKRILKNL
jgi:glutamyl-tRNA reductase